MGKRTTDAELRLTHAIKHNDRLRALTGRQRLQAVPRIAESDKQLELLQEQLEEAKRLDADEYAAAHAERVKDAKSDVAASREAEKIAASIDADINRIIAKFGKLTALIAPRFDRAKQAIFEAHGVPTLINQIEVNPAWIATAEGNERSDAALEQAELNRQYTLVVSDMQQALQSLATLHVTSPAASDALTNAWQRIRAAYSGEASPSKVLPLAAVHADVTVDLERHVEFIKTMGPK